MKGKELMGLGYYGLAWEKGGHRERERRKGQPLELKCRMWQEICRGSNLVRVIVGAWGLRNVGTPEEYVRWECE